MRIIKHRRAILLFGLCSVYLWNAYFLICNKGFSEIFIPKVLTLDELRRAVEQLNEAQTIYNEEQFSPVLEDTIIIAIQVHNRIHYLYHVIRSLSKVGFIEKALLVFSHDVYDEAINRLVRSINFTKVMQIYYPFSTQLYPNRFPGKDPHDCPKVKYGRPVRPDCENATFYRDANFAQIKQHWWWKANRIFNQLDCTANHSGRSSGRSVCRTISHPRYNIVPNAKKNTFSGEVFNVSMAVKVMTCSDLKVESMVLFLEDDQYVAPDILYMTLQLKAAADQTCPQCQVICFGSSAKISKSHKNIDKALITTWYTKIYNMGFVLNRTVWRSITEDEELFCNRNDYNWDISLLNLSQTRKGGPINVLLAMEARVYHFGKCGVHNKSRNCNASWLLGSIEKMVSRAGHLYYPPRIEVHVYSGRRRRGKRYKGGGWQDPRDQELCRNITQMGRQKKKAQTKWIL